MTQPSFHSVDQILKALALLRPPEEAELASWIEEYAEKASETDHELKKQIYLNWVEALKIYAASDHYINFWDKDGNHG